MAAGGRTDWPESRPTNPSVICGSPNEAARPGKRPRSLMRLKRSRMKTNHGPAVSSRAIRKGRSLEEREKRRERREEKGTDRCVSPATLLPATLLLATLLPVKDMNNVLSTSCSARLESTVTYSCCTTANVYSLVASTKPCVIN